MAIYHFHVGIVSRKTGRSAVGASAYRCAEKLKCDYDSITHDYAKSSAVNTSAYNSGEQLQNERIGMTHDYTRKRGVVHTEILLPSNAPWEYADRSTLWNAVEKSEKCKDAQTARDLNIALPIEFDRQEQIELSRKYIQENFVDKGMIADWALHDNGDGNPHFHVMLTTRNVNESGFGNKNRDWNNKKHLNSWRENWATACNEKFREKRLDIRIDHRTLEAQGIDREPTIHIGVVGKALEKKGITTERVQKNRDIIARNRAKELHKLKEYFFNINKEITELQEILRTTKHEMNVAKIKAEEINERAEHIENMKYRLDELKAEQRSMSIFKSKKNIDKQIQRHEHDYSYTLEYFEYAYKIKPQQTGAEVTQLEHIVENKKHLQAVLQEKLTSLTENQDKVVYEYQKQKLIADTSHDKEKIYKRLAELERESRPQKQSAQYAIMRERNQRLLDSVSEQNLQKIMQELSREQQRTLEKIRGRERERIRNYAMFRTR